MRSFFLYIVEDHRLAVSDLDPGDERVNETLPEGGVFCVPISERTKPSPDRLTGEPGLFHFCPLDLHEQLLLFGFQFRQATGKAPGPGALLDGVQYVPLALPV